MRFAYAFAALAVALVATPRPAGACSWSTPSTHVKDPAHASDTTPPSATIVTTSRVEYDEGSGCCGGERRWIDLRLEATDDRAKDFELGYKLTVVGGDPPSGFPATQTLRYGSGDRMLVYVDPDDDGFQFDLEIRAVDGNGNEGPPVAIEIEWHSDGGGCTTGNDLPIWALLVVGALVFNTVSSRRSKHRRSDR